ncbi:hypothetical protein Btru_066009 [Bulinus truncatus]|nr:hypothetical protein Btru_066009 [Bulinus truncatus]
MMTVETDQCFEVVREVRTTKRPCFDLSVDRLFETHPEVQNVFMPFRGQSKEILRESAQLKSHALRVMGTVDKCISRFQEPDKVKDLLHELGARHVMYNAKVDYMDLIGPQFIWAIEPVLGDRWTPEVEQAWADLFKFKILKFHFKREFYYLIQKN